MMTTEDATRVDEILWGIGEPAKSMPLKDFTAHVEKHLEKLAVSELQLLCRRFACGVDRLADKIARDKKGMGQHEQEQRNHNSAGRHVV